MYSVDLRKYGLNDEISAAAEAHPGCHSGRVLSQSKGIYRVICEKGELISQLSGRFRFEARSRMDYPAVGDFVMLDRNSSSNGHGVIHHVLPRKSAFIRKSVRTYGGEQIITANMDTIFICMSVNHDFNLRRLERYMVLTWESRSTPVVVLTKIDLCEDISRKFRAAASVAAGADILGVSVVAKEGFDDLRSYLSAGKTVALLGSSGAGKTTIVNWLVGCDVLRTQELRKDDKGRHTTTNGELLLLPQGGMIVDTPGMRELGLWNADKGVDQTFCDVERHLGKCRFRDCTHTTEPDCAIYKAIQEGELSEKRWMAYLKLKTEDRYTGNRAAYAKGKADRGRKIAKKTSRF